MNLRELVRLLASGGPGFCQIALTNACNARCRFCGFSDVPASEQVMADAGRLLSGLAGLRAAGVRYLSLTGGEPLLHPALEEIIAAARQGGMATLLVTNAARLSPEGLERLKGAGLGRLLISVDAADPEVHDAHRGLPGLSRHIRDLLPLAARLGLRPTASVTLSRLTGDLFRLAAALKAQGFAALTFSYPLTRLASPYLAAARDPLVEFAPEELKRLFQDLLQLKSASPLPLINTRFVLQGLIRWLGGQPFPLPCLAGCRYFFIDWHLRVYRCHVLGERLGDLEDFPEIPAAPRPCTGCLSECYLDASACQFLAVSLAQAREAFRTRRLRQGLGYLWQVANLRSLAALWESRHWLRQ